MLRAHSSGQSGHLSVCCVLSVDTIECIRTARAHQSRSSKVMPRLCQTDRAAQICSFLEMLLALFSHVLSLEIRRRSRLVRRAPSDQPAWDRDKSTYMHSWHPTCGAVGKEDSCLGCPSDLYDNNYSLCVAMVRILGSCRELVTPTNYRPLTDSRTLYASL
jgi:hypothetical protein